MSTYWTMDEADGLPAKRGTAMTNYDYLPVAVVDEESATQPGDRLTVVARFATVGDAERFIGTLPDQDKVERGGYGLDAPEGAR